MIYILQVALHIPGAYNLTLHLPIVIGTVPFRQGPTRYTSTRFFNETFTDYQNMVNLPVPPPYRETITPPPPFDGKITQ